MLRVRSAPLAALTHRRWHSMTRATRFAWSLAIATAVYLLFLFHIIPVPFIPEEVTDQILPTVRTP